jgi:iron complex outermembrane receptor protein
MKSAFHRVLCTTTALAGLLVASAAMAQSTGTALVEELVVTGSTVHSQNGAIVAEDAPKSRTAVTQEFLSTQAPGGTLLDQINLLPGVNFTNNDAFGSAGGDITLRGFDSQRLALIQDGIPLNDSGNYAVYPNQQMDSDLIERVEVNLGTTDVDSPTAAAAGGTINYITRKPQDEMGGRVELGLGSESFQRYYGTFETGKVGPWGTKAWISGLYTKNDIFDAPGQIKKKEFNARIWQDIGDRGDFVSLVANYDENRNNFIRRITLAQFNQRGVTANNLPDTTLHYDASCTRPAPVKGTAQNEATSATGFTAICANYVGNNINPSNTGNLRGQSQFHLTDNLILTVDPSFQYVIANGGGRTLFDEQDPQFRSPVDLNGDGDVLDRVLLYWPNTTNTRRYGVNSSLIWKFSDSQSIRAAYTYDYARHRQTGQGTQFDAKGDPADVFGGKDGYGPSINLPDNTILRRRDRLSLATLNQFAIDYRGRFMEDKLLVNVGVRAPFFKRELNQFCYMRDTFNALCTTQPGFVVTGTNDGAGVPFVVFPTNVQTPTGNVLASQTGGAGVNVLTPAQLDAFHAIYGATAIPSAYFGQPRKFTRKYDKVLPNLGVSYDFTDHQSAYVSYAETISVPRTDDLYDRNVVDPDPETSKSFDVGYRFTSPTILASIAAFHNDFDNRIERQFDEAAQIFYSVNVGKVKLQGFDGQVGWQPEKYISIYASASYVDSEIQSNFPNGTGGTILATKGKELYEIPKLQGAVRVSWDITDALTVGVQGKFVGSRWTNLTNTEKAPGYNLWDLDVRYKLDVFKSTYIQANVRNLFDERYLGDITTNTNGNGQFQPGYPREFVVTLHAEF